MLKFLILLSLIFYINAQYVPTGTECEASTARKVGEDANGNDIFVCDSVTVQGVTIACEHIGGGNEGCRNAPTPAPTTKPPTTKPPTTKPPTTKPPTTKPPTTKPPTTKKPTTPKPTKTTTTCYCTDPTQCANNRRLSELEQAANRRRLKKGKKKKGKSKGGKKKKKGKGGGGGQGCGDCDCDKTNGGMKSMTLRWAGSETVNVKVTSARRRLKKGKGGGSNGGNICEFGPTPPNGEGDCVASGTYSTNSWIAVSDATTGQIVCETGIHTSCSQDIVGGGGDGGCGTRIIVSGWSDANPDGNYCDDGYLQCDCSTPGAVTAGNLNNAVHAQPFKFSDVDEEEQPFDATPIIVAVVCVVVLALGVAAYLMWKRKNKGTASFEHGDEVEMEMDMDVNVETTQMTH